MEIIRQIVIGFVLGGAFGAKTATYFSSLFDGQSSFEAIKVGLTYGAAFGTLATALVLIIYALADEEKKASKTFSSRELMTTAS